MAEGRYRTAGRLPDLRPEARTRWKGLAFDQANVTGARALLRLFRRELDALPFAQQLKDRAAHGAAVEEVLDSVLVADETEPFVDQEACDCPRRHTRPSVPDPQGYPKGTQPVTGA